MYARTFRATCWLCGCFVCWSWCEYPRWAKVPPYVPMWVLFDGICHAFPTILASTIFVVIVIAIFAGLLISLLHEDQGIMTDPVLAELALLSLVQFLSGDGLADMYYTLMLARPELSLIFIPLFVLVTIGLMNLVPAILFENQAREKEYKQIIGQQRFQKEKVFTADGVTEVSNAGFQQPISQRNSELSNWMSCSQSWWENYVRVTLIQYCL